MNLRGLLVLAALATAPVAASAAPAYSASSWERDLADDAARARADRPDAWAKLHKLEGLRPTVYLKKRRPEPEVARELGELVRRDEVSAVMLASLLVGGLDDYPLSAAADFPPSAKAQHGELVALERTQLEDGLMLALGASQHPSAPWVAVGVLADDSRALARRRIAAIALGKTRSPLAARRLGRIASDEKAPLVLRTAAMQGLGHVRTPAALAALTTRVRAGGDREVRISAVTSLGQAASSWALAKEAREVSEAMRADATATLVSVLASGDAASTDDKAVHRAALASLGVVAHPSALPLLVAATQAARDDAARTRLSRAHRRLERVLSRAR